MFQAVSALWMVQIQRLTSLRLLRQQSLELVPQDRYIARRQPVAADIRVNFTCHGIRGVRLEQAVQGILDGLDMAE